MAFESITEFIELVVTAFDVLGVGMLVIGIGVATAQFVWATARRTSNDATAVYKIRIGRTMLLGLEVLIAADIVKTVALEVTVANMVALGALVVIRTFLSWTLLLEIDGRWPWQRLETEYVPTESSRQESAHRTH